MILFRADANKRIGSGHIMRCLSIADHAKQTGELCIFLTASSDLEKIIINHGHQAVVYHSDYKDMMSDLDLTKDWIERCHPSALIIDSYFVSADYLAALKRYGVKNGTKILYIDDLLSFAYPCDILINYNIYALERLAEYRKMYHDITVPQMLLGSNYVPLREEFQNIGIRKVKKHMKNIFISTGGADFEHIALSLTKEIACRQETLRDFTFHFIIGPMNQDFTMINTIAQGLPSIVIHSKVTNMSALMQTCDFAVSAAGSTLYELCATQTPAITYILADNQIPSAQGFEQYKLMKCIGDLRYLGKSRLIDMLLRELAVYADNYEERMRMAQEQRRLVDGNGAERILHIAGLI